MSCKSPGRSFALIPSTILPTCSGLLWSASGSTSTVTNGGPSAVSLSLALIIASSIAVLRLSPYILNACALIERDNPSSESLAPPETYAFPSEDEYPGVSGALPPASLESC